VPHAYITVTACTDSASASSQSQIHRDINIIMNLELSDFSDGESVSDCGEKTPVVCKLKSPQPSELGYIAKEKSTLRRERRSLLEVVHAKS
jgi:hypothetical protein